MFSITYKTSKPSICSVLFQFQIRLDTDLSQNRVVGLPGFNPWISSGSASNLIRGELESSNLREGIDYSEAQDHN
jgi:hypothetical protein